MNQNPFTKLLSLSLAACLLAGCSSTSSPSSTSSSSSAPDGGQSASSSAESPSPAGDEAPLVVTMYLGCSVVEFPPDGNEIETMIEEYVGGVDFKISAYSGTVLHEMMPTLIASGDMPMVANVGGSQLSKSYMIDAMRGGEFWDVTDYINNIDNFRISIRLLSAITPLQDGSMAFRWSAAFPAIPSPIAMTGFRSWVWMTRKQLTS